MVDKAALPTKPKVVVGLDFGTTYSGFAFAHVSDPDRIYTFYDYPKGTGEKPYCKTLTACYYKQEGADPEATWTLHSWGYPARRAYEDDIQALHKYRKSDSVAPQAPSVGVFLSRFKLHLASRSTEVASSATPLPPGLTVTQVITDYLRELGRLILKHLQSKYGAHFSTEMVQWCITVPSIWDNAAKATMRTCMVSASLVSADHRVTIVLEPEAASFHCQRVMKEITLKPGNRLLVADIGGGTSDIVVQEVVRPGRVKEVTMSSGGLCGGTYVDFRFMEFLKGRVGQACITECILKHHNVYGQLMREWECTKTFFDRGQGVTTMNLPSKLAAEWEGSDAEGAHRDYDELEITSREMQSIFDPVVQENVDLILQQMREAKGKVQVLAMVGGFSESPYLLRRMREAFGAMAENIVSPPNPGSAICQGAVALALHPNAVLSRICKLTYGFKQNRSFEEGVDPIEKLRLKHDGTRWCRDRFKVLVKKGDAVVLDEAMPAICLLFHKFSTSVSVNLFTCDDSVPPRYTTDKQMQQEGELVMDISKDMELEDRRKFEVSLYFGGSSLEVKARAVNFKAEQVQLPVQVDYLLH